MELPNFADPSNLALLVGILTSSIFFISLLQKNRLNLINVGLTGTFFLASQNLVRCCYFLAFLFGGPLQEELLPHKTALVFCAVVGTGFTLYGLIAMVKRSFPPSITTP